MWCGHYDAVHCSKGTAVVRNDVCSNKCLHDWCASDLVSSYAERASDCASSVQFDITVGHEQSAGKGCHQTIIKLRHACDQLA